MATPCSTGFITEKSSDITITPHAKSLVSGGSSKKSVEVEESYLPLVPLPMRCIYFHTNILHSLDDSILIGILFSGYLSAKDIFSSVIFINKRIQLLSKQFINYLQLRSVKMESIRFTYSLSNIQYLDFGYVSSDISTNPDFSLSKLINPSNKLKLLSLRGTRATNNSLADTNYESIEYLDVSKMKISQFGLITDVFVANYVKKMSQLKVLDLSMTGITDDSIALIADHLPDIKVLLIAICENLTDNMLPSLSRLFLRTLDVSGCTKLTIQGFQSLFTKKHDDEVFRPFLKDTLAEFNASFLPRVTDELINLVQKNCSRIQYLEFRGCRVIRPGIRDEALKAIQTAIFQTADIPSRKKRPFEQVLDVRKYCPQIHWPYSYHV